MLETDRAAMAARLEALERVIDGARHIAPYLGEFADRDERDAAARLDRLLRDAIREAFELRKRVRLPSAMERVEIGCVALWPAL
jgi:hypothetical protein